MNSISAASFAVSTVLACAFAQDPLPVAGYHGTWPSDAGKAALAAIPKTWEDKASVLGGGSWSVSIGKITMYGLGPGRADVIEMSSASRKGPHVRLQREHLAVSLPTESDGDVVATLRWLGVAVPAGLEGEPSQSWQRATANIAALGEAAGGIRIGLMADKETPTSISVMFWNVGEEKTALVGKPTLVVDGVPLPVTLQWPPKEKRNVGAAANFLVLEPGSLYNLAIDLRKLVDEHGKKGILGDGPHMLEFTLQPDRGEQREAPALISSRKETITIGPKATDASGGKKDGAKKER